MLTQRSILRKKIRQQRLQLDPKYREKADASIVNQLLTHPILDKGQHIAAYLAAEGEAGMATWFKSAWEKNKQVYLPKIVEKKLLFAEYTENTPMITNQWGILEPQTDAFILPSALDVVIVPLVAFDKKGNRLGRGAGHYDRAFSFLKNDAMKQKTYLLGLGYAFQEVPLLHSEHWDVPLQSVITEASRL